MHCLDSIILLQNPSLRNTRIYKLLWILCLRSFLILWFEDVGTSTTRTLSNEIFALLSALNHLERISDQAKNICEEAVFLVTGETKPFKVYNILFVDERNDALSQMAEAIARKAYPGSGIYTSRGLHPAASLHAGMVDFMHRHGYDFTDVCPQSLDLTPEELENFHVIVSFGDSVTNYVGNVPFHSVDLEWKLFEPAAEDEEKDNDWEEIYQQLLQNIHHLMEALRGVEAP